MTTRAEGELNFVKRRDPIASIEVDLDSIPDELFGYEGIVLQALKAMLVRQPTLRTSLYVFESTSVNFGSPCYSVFFGLAGGEKHLPALLSGFKRVEGIKAKASDYIETRRSVCRFHVEDGDVWYPQDVCVWQTCTK